MENNVIMKKTFTFGKIKYQNCNGCTNLVTVKAELRRCGGESIFTIDKQTGEKVVSGKTPEYIEFSAYGEIWNSRGTDILCGGQCLDTIMEYKGELEDKQTFETLYFIWKKYHLNGMHAGTPEQEAAIEKWKAQGNQYEYSAVCEMLKSCGLYEVNYTGLSVGRRYNDEPYKYGHAWLIQELPGDVLLKLEHLLSA